MKRLSMWIARVALGIVISATVTWFAMPPAERSEDGAADPIVWVRRPILKALGAVGLAPRSLIAPDPWLPGESVSESWAGGPAATFADGASATRLTMTSEPVYRGALWHVGFRVTIRLETRGASTDEHAGLALWTSTGTTRSELVRAASTMGTTTDGVRRIEVRGFVPDEADRFGYAEVTADGRSIDGSWWGR